jgi:branched-chain amino acid aminotransferase
MEYASGRWQNPRIRPYAPFSLDPSSSVFHYGQAVFEGLKAFKNSKGEIRIFRPRENFLRMRESCERLCIPPVAVDDAMDALAELVRLDADWIPTSAGTALYIRPSVIAVDAALGVHAAKNYIFFIILSPVGAYYANGLAPVKLFVEERYVRAAKGGTGHNKVIGNYAASLLAAENAEKLGCDQVMWLDAKENRFVEEVGSMNIFFVINGRVVTPALSGSILPGITRKSVIELLKAQGIPVTERAIAIDEVVAACENGTLTEIFGTGTAAVISPVGSFLYRGKNYTVATGAMGGTARKIYDELTGIQTGERSDSYEWVFKL